MKLAKGNRTDEGRRERNHGNKNIQSGKVPGSRFVLIQISQGQPLAAAAVAKELSQARQLPLVDAIVPRFGDAPKLRKEPLRDELGELGCESRKRPRSALGVWIRRESLHVISYLEGS